MTTPPERPAWSLVPDSLPRVDAIPLVDEITPDWAWGGSDGEGVRVAVIDSGVDAGHPAVGGVDGYVALGGPDGSELSEEPHEDVFGHGTACAGIIRSLAPRCELHSVRVLGPSLTGRGPVFARGVQWAVENGMRVCNLSLGSTRRDLFEPLHELADVAYFRNVVLVTAANNVPVPSAPSLYASVISVAAHEIGDPFRLYYNPAPPVEFGAPGIDVRVAWKGGTWITATGNSFAAPHVAGLVAKILGKHPGLTVPHLKVILRAVAANVRRAA
ncbi:MAG: S8 family serine peptidase [Thermoleophilia bacterium]|nr:S8 family serine peptidase [Thermoleophilia bacterium]